MRKRTGKSRFLAHRVYGTSGEKPSFREITAGSGKTRTISFYVPKADVLLWNAFVRYTIEQRGENVNRAIMRAIRMMVSHLDYDEQRRFRLAIRNVVEEDVSVAKEARELLEFILQPGESIEKILMDRSRGMVKRRMELYKRTLEWFGKWDEYKEEFGLKEPTELE